MPAVESLGVSADGSFAERIARRRAEFATVARASDDLAAILYTSGTTGRSKGAMLTHENLASNALALVDIWRFTSADVLIHALPVFHTHGLFVATNVALLSRGDDDLPAALRRRRGRRGAAARDEPDGRADVLYEAPRACRPDARIDGANMRLFVSGSAPLLAETQRRGGSGPAHAILERYGMTETNMIASNPYEGERRARHGWICAARRQPAHRRSRDGRRLLAEARSA